MLEVDRILHGDALTTLRLLPSESVHCVVTSPPYFGLRDYGVDGQMGLEATPAEYIANMVAVFAEVRRVLRSDGTAWVNMGDSYANDGKWGGSSGGKHAKGLHGASGIGRQKRTTGLKPKDLVGMPWMLAFALREDGWWLRSDIIWHKSNPMPESVTDRPTRAHEYIFQFAKSGKATCWQHRESGQWAYRRPAPDYRWVHRTTKEYAHDPQAGSAWRRVNMWRAHDYYYDADAIREPIKPKTLTTYGCAVRSTKGNDALGGVKADNWARSVSVRKPRSMSVPTGWDTSTGAGGHGSIHREGRTDKQRGHSRRHAGFNDRWDAMSKEDQQAMGANKRDVWTVGTRPYKGAHFATFPPALIEPCILAGCPAGGVILDPFMGAGTVGVVARRHSRHYLGIELNTEYIALAEARIAAEVQPELWTSATHKEVIADAS